MRAILFSKTVLKHLFYSVFWQTVFGKKTNLAQMITPQKAKLGPDDNTTACIDVYIYIYICAAGCFFETCFLAWSREHAKAWCEMKIWRPRTPFHKLCKQGSLKRPWFWGVLGTSILRSPGLPLFSKYLFPMARATFEDVVPAQFWALSLFVGRLAYGSVLGKGSSETATPRRIWKACSDFQDLRPHAKVT